MTFQDEYSKLINWEKENSIMKRKNMQKTLAKKRKKVRNEKQVLFKTAKYTLA